MPRTHRPAAQRREEILDAAHTLFTTKGFQPTTMEAILKVVGIAKGTLKAIMAAMQVEGTESELIEQFHTPGNAEFHLLSITAMIEHLTPVLADVVTQGVSEGSFTTERPYDAIELLLSASGILLDHEILEAGPDELARRHESLVWASETLLGAQPGSLSILAEADS